MAKNKITDLNNHLFAQLERLSDEDLRGEALIEEVRRARSVTEVAQQVIASGDLLLKARIAADNTLTGTKILPQLFE